MIGEAIQYILHLNVHLGALLNEYGLWTYAILFLIIFCETGLVITPFLPGDSLLFAAGSVFASSHLSVHWLSVTLMIAAFCGDNVNYWIGRWVGPHVFTKGSRFFKQDYLLRTHSFYERYGAKAIILARFIPIVRTFIPFVAGIGEMTYHRFLVFSALAAIIWINLLLYVSYWFGNVPWVKNNFSIIILAIIILSVLPPIIEILKKLRTR